MTGVNEPFEYKPPAFGLSKSRIAAFEQCPRRLWLQFHSPQVAAAGQDSALRRLAVGNEVGSVARALIPDGEMVEADPDLQAALDHTAELIVAADRPIFEATLEHDGVLVRIDVLMPIKVCDEQAWHLVEVKSSTTCKDYHVADLATQLWVAESCGLKIANASVRHLNSGFVLKRAGEYANLFRDAEFFDNAAVIANERQSVVEAARRILIGEKPQCSTGSHCRSPFDCEFVAHCKESEPKLPEWPIAELPNTGKRLAATWAESQIYDLRELPNDAELNALHERIRQSVRSGHAYADSAAFSQSMAQWPYPRTWLDFETIAFAVPRWLGTKPWEAIPFQFSAHVEQADGSIEHLEALDLTGNDPRPTIAEALLKLPSSGGVMAWNKSYEAMVLRALAKAVPHHKAELLSLADRLVDPMPLAKAHYYHPDQRGSFSIKYVLPTIAPDLDYQALDVPDGMAAQAAYLEAIAPDCTPERNVETAAALRQYCGQDTWAMVVICDRLSGMQRP